jgi:hypothetical protein
MRHFLLLSFTISSDASCMIDPPPKGPLIALSSKKNGRTAGRFRAVIAIDVAAIAVTADQDLTMAVRTVVETG